MTNTNIGICIFIAFVCYISLDSSLKKIEKNLVTIEKELSIIRHILIIKNIMPAELAKEGE